MTKVAIFARIPLNPGTREEAAKGSVLKEFGADRAELRFLTPITGKGL